MTRPVQFFSPLLAVLCLLILGGCSKEKKTANQLKDAEKDYAAGDYSAARINFLNVLKADPGNERALTRLGEIWMNRGSSVQALPYLLAAKSAAPEGSDARAQLAIALYSVGHRPEALKETLAVLDRDPTHIEAARNLSQLVQTPAEITDASARFEKLKEVAPATYHSCLATLALRQRDPTAAEEEYKKALAVDDTNDIAHLGLARLASYHEDEDEALRHHQLAQAHLPPYSRARTAMAEYLIQRKEFPTARKELEGIIKEVPDLIPAQWLLAKINAHEKKFAQADTVLERILDLDATHLDSLILRGEILRFHGKNEEALAHFKAALEIELFNSNPLLLLNLAQTQVALGDDSEALATLKTATSVTASNPEANLLLAKLELKAGNPTSAQSALQPVLERTPDLSAALVIQGEIFRMTGQLVDAATVFEKLVSQNEKNVAARLRLASILQTQNKLADAREQYRLALEQAPGNFFIITQLIELDLQAEDFTAAHAKADEILAAKPDLEAAHYLKARIQHSEENWSAALASLAQCPQLALENEGVSILRISCLLRNKEPELARTELKKLTSQFPDRPSPLLAAALVYEELGDFARARDLHEQVLALAPETIASLNNLAVLLTDHFNEPEKARELAEQARALRPSEPAVLDTLGWVRYQQGDYTHALTLLQKAAPGLRGNIDSQRHLGLAAYRLARPELALPALRLVASSNSPLAETVTQPLALLEDFQSDAPAHGSAELQEILAQSPDDIIALLLLARTQSANKQPAESEKSLLRAVSVNDKLAEPHKALAALYLDSLDNPERALAHAKEARMLDLKDPKTAVLLGRSLLRAGDFKQAHALLHEGRGKLPPTAALCHDLAWTSYYTGNPADATSLMREALALTPSPALKSSAEQFLATVALDDLANSRPIIQSTLTSDSHHVPALLAQARLSLRDGDRTKSEQSLRTILDKAPEFLPALKELAALLVLDPAHLEEARELASKARDADPTDPTLARTLAQVSFLQKKYSYAIQLFEQSARATPLDARSLYFLGLAYQETDAHAKAKASLTQALALGLPDHEAAAARKALKALP